MEYGDGYGLATESCALLLYPLECGYIRDARVVFDIKTPAVPVGRTAIAAAHPQMSLVRTSLYSLPQVWQSSKLINDSLACRISPRTYGVGFTDCIWICNKYLYKLFR